VSEKPERIRISFDSGGVELVGYLHHAAGNADGDAPCVVMGHGFSGTQDRLFANAKRFAGAGFAVLTFDYRSVASWAPAHYIPMVGKPGEVAVTATPQAQEHIAALSRVTGHSLWRNEVAPRGLFGIMRYRPGDEAHRLGMPLLVCV
jgi:dienelactone hydrolase